MADTAAKGTQAGRKGSTVSRWVSTVQMDGLVAQSLYLTNCTSKKILSILRAFDGDFGGRKRKERACSMGQESASTMQKQHPPHTQSLQILAMQGY